MNALEKYQQSVKEVAQGDWTYQASKEGLMIDWLNRDEKLSTLLDQLSCELKTYVTQYVMGDEFSAKRGFDLIKQFIEIEIKEDIKLEKWESADD